MTFARFMLLAAFSVLLALPAGARDDHPLTITGKAAHTFRIDVVDSDPERNRGLMHRTDIPDDYGMLFLFESPRPVTMWMKNTPHSLDMLFIDETGTITGIAPSTTPFSEAIIPSPGPVIAVLEIAGGVSERLGLAPGDQVVHPRLPIVTKDAP